jgi:hypothetical protein
MNSEMVYARALSMKAKLAGASVLCAFVAFGGTAWAQSGAAAEALYKKGLADMKAGRYETGCPALAESVRLDRRAGALFTLAECEAKWGKLARAVADYDDFLAWVARMSPADQSQQSERQSLAQKQRERLGELVPHVTLELPPDAPSGVSVELDGVALNRPAIGIALPVDPGAHHVVVRTDAGHRSERTFEIKQGESQRVSLALPQEQEAAPATPPAASGAAPPPPRRAERPISTEPAAGSGTSTWTYVAFGVGAAGIAVGGVTGALALGQKSTVDANCEAHVCNHDGKVAADRLQSYATVSTIGFGVGLVGLAVGTGLLLSGPSHAEATSRHPVGAYLAASSSGGLAGVRGAW